MPGLQIRKAVRWAARAEWPDRERAARTAAERAAGGRAAARSATAGTAAARSAAARTPTARTAAARTAAARSTAARGLVAAAAVAACVLAAVPAVPAVASATRAPTPGENLPAQPPASRSPGHFTPAIRLAAHVAAAGERQAGEVVFDCQKPSAGERTCYGPHQLRVAYGIQPLLDRGITGAGRTIVIVAAYAPPGLDEDLQKFDQAFGLPDPQLRIVAPQGAVWDPGDPNQLLWAGEIDSDLQWAHAIAPGARIVLVEARSDDDHDLAAAVAYAVDHRLGDVISQSFGEDERCTPPEARRKLSAAYRRAAAADITVVAASGDTGAGQFVCDPNSGNLRKAAAFPASDPRVLAVGGTQLTADLSSGAYHGEVAWNDEDPESASATGGGYSMLFDRPRYQDGAVTRKGRGLPDVAYSSASNGAVMVYVGQDGKEGKFYGFFGTSVAAPQWSGIVALAAQMGRHRLGLLNPTIYRAAAGARAGEVFHDIQTGDNSVRYLDDSGKVRTISGYPAAPGWDAVTGVGSPIASQLVPLLAGAGRQQRVAGAGRR